MGISLFEVFFGEKQSWNNELAKKRDFDVPTAKTRAMNIMAMRKLVEKCLAKAIAVQTKHYNAKHLLRIYNVGEFVYLNSRNIDSTHLMKKLDWKYYGPYKVVNQINKQAYWLNLLISMKIHNVFHVSLLESCNLSRDGKAPLAFPLIIIDGEENFEIEEIFNSRNHYGKLQYLIKWLGYPDSDNQ